MCHLLEQLICTYCATVLVHVFTTLNNPVLLVLSEAFSDSVKSKNLDWSESVKLQLCYKSATKMDSIYLTWLYWSEGCLRLKPHSGYFLTLTSLFYGRDIWLLRTRAKHSYKNCLLYQNLVSSSLVHSLPETQKAVWEDKSSCHGFFPKSLSLALTSLPDPFLHSYDRWTLPPRSPTSISTQYDQNWNFFPNPLILLPETLTQNPTKPFLQLVTHIC